MSAWSKRCGPATARAPRPPEVRHREARPKPPLSANARSREGRMYAEMTGRACVESQTKFQRTVPLTQLGVALVVDSADAEYIPAHRTSSSRAPGAAPQARAELAQYLFESTRGGDDHAAVTTHTLDALRQLPPGVLDATPYLQHVQARCEAERESSTSPPVQRGAEPAFEDACAAADEAAFFERVKQALESSGIDMSDEEAVRRCFVAMARDRAQRTQDVDCSMEPPAAIRKAPRPSTARSISSSRPPSAKCMLSTAAKRSFLTELCERRMQPASDMAPDAEPMAPPASSPANIADITGPKVTAATKSAEARLAVAAVRVQEVTSSLRRDTAHVLDSHAAYVDHSRTVCRMRRQVRDLKHTSQLYRRIGSANRSRAAGPTAAGAGVQL